MIVFANTITARLRYIVQVVGLECSGNEFRITDKVEEYRSYTGPRINYSGARITDEEIWISPHALLFEKGIHQQTIECFQRNGAPCFFKTEGDTGFDIFAAAFYLLSRYEEYLPHRKDEYGRYAHENSLAFKEGFLKIPLVNNWILEFRKLLQTKFSALANSYGLGDLFPRHFQFIPTYDIDEAWSYKHKTLWRSAGGALRDLLKGDLKKFNLRRAVLDGKAPDPYDSYSWIDDLHRSLPSLKPRYFFHIAAKNGKYDKNNLPSEKAMQTLIQQHAEKYSIGLHPSWQSGDDPSLLRSEKETLEKISSRKITASRQHFIRFNLPETFRRLIDADIKEDFSMGYGSINGFRASFSSPFPWYDLEKDQVTSLTLNPFCFMEANSFFEMKHTPEQALEEMRHYREVIRKVNGVMVTIWHNTFLGTDSLFKGWREIYKNFLAAV